MTTPTAAARLGKRLKDLRETHRLTQRQLGELLFPAKPISPAMISAWEGGRAVPVEKWIDAYIQVFSRPAAGGEPGPEEAEIHRLLKAQLVPLREEAAVERPAVVAGGLAATSGIAPQTRPHLDGDRFWHFPDGQPIRIVGSRFPEDVPDDIIGTVPYTNPAHPNHMSLLRFSDADAVVELFGHIRAENPNSDVRFMTPERVIPDDLNGHVVIVGGVDYNPLAGWFADQMDVPVGGRTTPAEDSQDDLGEPWVDAAFTVRDSETGEVHKYRPRFDGELETKIRVLADPGTREVSVSWPNLVSDLALVARQRNPHNATATATLCYGLYARGTYGAARIFTDARVRDANEKYVRELFGDMSTFWMLVKVRCNQRLGMAMTPDLTLEGTRVRVWKPE